MASTQPPFLSLQDAVVRRAGKAILSIDSFAMPEGECIALLGPNGSGKSTFVRLITREVFPLYRDFPPVLFRGQERPLLEEVRASLGIVSSTMQDQIRVHLPAIDVVVGGLFGALGVPKRFNVGEFEYTKARQAMEELGISHLAEHDIMELSTGEARRVLIARSLIHDPDVLIFDEPCTGLDPEGMYYVRKSMRLLAQSGRALLLVTHYPEDIIPEVTRILLLKEGKVFGDGSKESMLTDQWMSALFDVPLHVIEEHGYYSLSSEY